MFNGVDGVEYIGLSTGTREGSVRGGGGGERLEEEGGNSSKGIEGGGFTGFEAGGLKDLSDGEFCDGMVKFGGGKSGGEGGGDGRFWGIWS